MTYQEFLSAKLHYSDPSGFEPGWMPAWLHDFQATLVDWSLRQGRTAIFADCGLGKTPMQLVWAQNIVQHMNRPVLVVAPLSASAQTVREAAKFQIPAHRNLTGAPESAHVVITNYERLHLFRASDFAGVVCDESSILKNFDGATKQAVTEFLRRVPFRLLCTATAAPNDYIELGTSSEALGQLGYTDMLGRFFSNDESSIEPMSYSAKWRLKPHATHAFWQWLCSWARAVRKPSDIGGTDGPFVLPPLAETVSVIATSRAFAGQLFVRPAETLQEQREERRATIRERCEAVAARVRPGIPFVSWCHLNDEANLLERLIPGARQVSGSQPDELKEELFEAFSSGQLQTLITKPRIGAFGMNWQHCADLSVFPSHSYEQYYQAVRRCWRYGQTRPVTVHVITTEGEADVLANLQRKAAACDAMFAAMVAAMRHELHIAPDTHIAADDLQEIPSWLSASSPTTTPSTLATVAI